ncbi:MAG: hypothetical protein ACD_28C00011G0019 [uncultured bacterium]|nr:MAG: hypothetical protein ACD_28C00011G0019 [uncultured bacterium]
MIVIPKNFNKFIAVDQFTSQRVLRHESDPQNRVTRIFNIIFKMMQDAPKLTHARGGNEDHWNFTFIDFLGVLDIGNVPQAPESERIVPFFQELFLSLIIKIFQMHPKHFGEIAGEGAIDHNGKVLRDTLGVKKAVQGVHNFLRPSQRKCRNDEFSAFRDRVIDDAGKLVLHIHDGFVQTIAIGGLDHQIIDGGDLIGIFEDG